MSTSCVSLVRTFFINNFKANIRNQHIGLFVLRFLEHRRRLYIYSVVLASIYTCKATILLTIADTSVITGVQDLVLYSTFSGRYIGQLFNNFMLWKSVLFSLIR